MKLTAKRLEALRSVAAGRVEYSLPTGTFEPMDTYRLPAFDWLDEKGLTRVEYDAEPVGRISQRVPVVLTAEGERVLRGAGE